MKKLALLTAVLALAASTALAQDIGQQQDIVQPNTGAPAAQQPAATPAQTPAPAPGPVSTFPTPPAAVTCKLISVSVPAMPKDKPATYHVLVKDNVAGLLDELKTCNPNTDVAAFKANSAVIKVTQANGQAYFKVPTARSTRLMLSFSTSQANWTAERFWDSAGPIGERTEVTLVVAQAGVQSK